VADEGNVATVDAHSAAYDAMADKWPKIDALIGGTQAMRDAGEEFLPKMELEDQSAYERRLAQSFLFNAYADTVRKVSSKPFTTPVSVEGEEKLHEQLKAISGDADRAGTDLTQLGRELFWIGINRGMFHILVDYPQAPEGETPTKEDDEATGRRPVMIPLWPDQLFAWKTREGANGETILSQARIYEQVTRSKDEPDDFGEEVVERIRVFNEKTWEVWEKMLGEDAYAKVSDGTLSRPGVPIVTGYFEKTELMTADPPLEDLAWLNIEHWQSSSDQRNILRFARTGVWWMKGVSEDEADALSLGPSQKAWSKSADADMKVIEHSGSAVQCGERDLTKLEERMQLMGLRPFLQQARGATATSQTINEARGETEIQSWIRSIERALISAYQMAAEWIKSELSKDFKIDIVTEFATSLREQQDVTSLLEARKIKDISRETLLKELKRRRILGEDVVIADEVDSVEKEAPDLSLLSASPTGGRGDDAGDGDEE
jgi:hypothetical protein